MHSQGAFIGIIYSLQEKYEEIIILMKYINADSNLQRYQLHSLLKCQVDTYILNITKKSLWKINIYFEFNL